MKVARWYFLESDKNVLKLGKSKIIRYAEDSYHITWDGSNCDEECVLDIDKYEKAVMNYKYSKVSAIFEKSDKTKLTLRGEVTKRIVNDSHEVEWIVRWENGIETSHTTEFLELIQDEKKTSMIIMKHDAEGNVLQSSKKRLDFANGILESSFETEVSEESECTHSSTSDVSNQCNVSTENNAQLYTSKLCSDNTTAKPIEKGADDLELKMTASGNSIDAFEEHTRPTANVNLNITRETTVAYNMPRVLAGNEVTEECPTAIASTESDHSCLLLKINRQNTSTPNVVLESPIDNYFFTEVQALRNACLPPSFPPLNLNDFGHVWKIISTSNRKWHYLCGSSNQLPYTIYFRVDESKVKPIVQNYRRNFDYFLSEEELLNFVKNQFLAHGIDYEGLRSLRATAMVAGELSYQAAAEKMNNGKGVVKRGQVNNISMQTHRKEAAMTTVRFLRKRTLFLDKNGKDPSDYLRLLESTAEESSQSNKKKRPRITKGIVQKKVPHSVAINPPDEKQQETHVSGVSVLVPSIPSRTYRELIKSARVLLSPSAPISPLGRDEIVESINIALRKSLFAIGAGDRKQFRNLYICGLPGMGKTFCIENVLNKLEDAEHEEGLSKLTIVRLQGTTMQSSNELYNVLATKLELDVRSGPSSREAVLSRFRNDNQCEGKHGARRIRGPITVLFIDEIDRAPTEAVKELLEIAETASTIEDSENVQLRPFACNLVVIGAANNVIFPQVVGISGGAQNLIKLFPFKPYTADQLFSILKARTEGLFDDRCMKMIALKVGGGNSDVRMLLQLADRSLWETTQKYRREIANREKRPIDDLTLIPIVHANPLEHWDDPVTEVEPFVLTKDYCKVSIDMGHGPTRETQMVSDISDGARALLVAIVCYGQTDTTNSLKGIALAKPFNVKEMRQALITYIEVKKASGVIIGHDTSDICVCRWVAELHMNALIEGGESTFGGSRSFGQSRLLQDRDKIKYRLRVAPINILRYDKLEIVHKNSLTEYLSYIQKQKEILNPVIDV